MMEEHIKYKMLFSLLFIALVFIVVVVFAVAIKTDRETPVKEPEDISVIDNKIYEEYEKGTNSEEVKDEYVLDNGVYYLDDHAVIKFTNNTSDKKALNILSDFAEAYEYNEEEDSYEVVLKKKYSYNDLINYCKSLTKSYSRIISCDIVTK